MNGAYAEDPRLRFRIWVAGRLADEAWLDTTHPDAQAQTEAIQLRQAGIAEAAHEARQPWLAEVYDPAKPDDAAYIRWGTDTEGMHEPVELADAPKPLRDLFLPEPGP